MLSLREATLVLVLFCFYANVFALQYDCGKEAEWCLLKKNSKFPPFVIKTNNSLKEVFYPDNRKYPINLVSKDSSSCQVLMGTSYRYRHIRQHMATSLGNGQAVFWILSTRYAGLTRESEWSFSVVDPETCSIGFNFKIGNWVPESMGVVDVIPYEDTFDVVMSPAVDSKDRKNAMVFRAKTKEYDLTMLDGTDIPVLEYAAAFDSTRVVAVNDRNPSAGYYYLQFGPYKYDSKILKLDSSFKTTDRVNLTSFNEDAAFSTAHESLTLCQFEPTYRRDVYYLLRCSFRNSRTMLEESELQHKDPTEALLEQPRFYDLMNLPNGDIMVAYVAPLRDIPDPFVYLKVLNKQNTKVRKTELGRVRCTVRNIQIFEMMEQEYCVSIMCNDEILKKCLTVDFKESY